ncbi:MAG: C40 family peptidase, partial [Quinella sp. 1Q7]|nr:C40 family peptidase [Quinella sp. 1Q7]
MANISNEDSYTLVSGTSGDDLIDNYGDNVTINGGDGNDSIENMSGSYVTIFGGAGNDYIDNMISNVSISGDAGNDYIDNMSDNVTILGGAGNDSIDNMSDNVTISGGTGKDYIENNDSENVLFMYSSGDSNDKISGFNETSTLQIGDGTGTYSTQQSGNNIIVTVGKGKITLSGAASLSTVNIKGTLGGGQSSKLISLTSGADNYTNTVSGATILALGSDDFIDNYGDKVSINGGDGDDYIYNNGANTSISGGNGDDSITNSGANVKINGGNGDDSITNSGANVKINGGNGYDSIENNGSDVTINGGAGNDSIDNYYVDNVSIDGGAGNDYIHAEGDSLTINGGDGNDYIANYGDSVKIDGGSGNDYIYNNGDYVTVNGGTGNDSIKNSGYYASINAGAGNDSIYNDSGYNNSTISGGDGNDYIWNSGGSKVSISGGKGNDSIRNWSENVTISGGKSNDYIYNDGDNVLFKYSAGDGNDSIVGFDDTSTLSIAGAAYSTVKSGNNIIVTVGDGKITLSGAATLSTVNIAGKTTSSWSLNGTTATYGKITVKGVKSTSGLSLSGKVVTVSKASLGTSNVTITKGYTLKLGSNVSAPVKTAAGWTFSKSTATYKSASTTAGYTLASRTCEVTDPYFSKTSADGDATTSFEYKSGYTEEGWTQDTTAKISYTATTKSTGDDYATLTTLSGDGLKDSVTLAELNSGATVNTNAKTVALSSGDVLGTTADQTVGVSNSYTIAIADDLKFDHDAAKQNLDVMANGTDAKITRKQNAGWQNSGTATITYKNEVATLELATITGVKAGTTGVSVDKTTKVVKLAAGALSSGDGTTAYTVTIADASTSDSVFNGFTLALDNAVNKDDAKDNGTVKSALPCTENNLIRQAFRFLGEGYGWGGLEDGVDCSAFVQDVYRSVGIELPRDADRQAKAMPRSV